MRSRLTAAARLMALLALEAAAVPLLLASGSPAGGVDWSHLERWLSTAPAEDAVVSVVRLVALGLATWLLATTLLYLLARLTAAPSLVRGTQWATLPGIRKVVDAAVAASIVGGAVVGAHPAGAQIPAPPPTPIVVELDTTTTSRPAHLYVPVPAGDRLLASTTTVTTNAPSSPPVAPAPRPAPGQQPAGLVHTVVAGDNLWTIAAADLSRQTGRVADDLAEAEVRDYWLKVIEANRHRLLSGDPDLIYPGEAITCPPAG